MPMKPKTNRPTAERLSKLAPNKFERQLVIGREFLKKYREVFRALSNRH